MASSDSEAAAAKKLWERKRKREQRAKAFQEFTEEQTSIVPRPYRSLQAEALAKPTLGLAQGAVFESREACEVLLREYCELKGAVPLLSWGIKQRGRDLDGRKVPGKDSRRMTMMCMGMVEEGGEVHCPFYSTTKKREDGRWLMEAFD